MSRRSARRRAADEAIDRMAAAKASGLSALETMEDDEFKEDDVYDVVTEDQYADLVSSRRRDDDFVVDDEGYGYADDGEENWDEYEDYRRTGRISKVAQKGRKKQKTGANLGPEQKVSSLFLGGGTTYLGPEVASRGTAIKLEDDEQNDLLDGLLDDLTSNPLGKDEKARENKDIFARAGAKRKADSLQDVALFGESRIVEKAMGDVNNFDDESKEPEEYLAPKAKSYLSFSGVRGRYVFFELCLSS